MKGNDVSQRMNKNNKEKESFIREMLYGLINFVVKMTIAEYQKSVNNWIQTIGVRYFSPLTNMAILTEEVGEVARIMARMSGEQYFKENENVLDVKQKLADELGDVFWVATCIANQNGIDLTEAINNNFKKKNERDKLRHTSNPKLKS